MQYKRLGNTHIAFRLNPGEELVSSIETIARKEGVTSAMIQGLGATNDIVLETYHADEKKYYHHRLTGDFEITPSPALSISLTMITMHTYISQSPTKKVILMVVI